MIADIKQFEFVHPDLRALVLWLERETGLTFIITSLYRIGDTGVHGTLPVRGIDLRMRNCLIGKAIEKFMNDIWTYDPTRPEKQCCMLHGKGSNMHLHLQVHPNTKRIS